MIQPEGGEMSSDIRKMCEKMARDMKEQGASEVKATLEGFNSDLEGCEVVIVVNEKEATP